MPKYSWDEGAANVSAFIILPIAFYLLLWYTISVKIRDKRI